MVSANMMMAAMYSLKHADISIKDKIKKLGTDFSQEEIEMLSFATVTGMKKRFAQNMLKHKYRTAYLLLSATTYVEYAVVALRRLKKLKITKNDIGHEQLHKRGRTAP